MKRPTAEQNIALGVTVVAALLLLLLLWGVKMPSHDPAPVAGNEEISVFIPPQDDEPEFIEPILEDAGQHTDINQDSPDAAPSGEPDLSETVADKLVVNGPNPTPNKENEPLAATTAPSQAKTATPSPKDSPDSRIAGEMKNSFSAHNGRSDGKADASGTALQGNGQGVAGVLGNGRKLEWNPTMSVSITRTTVVTVTVMVRADGTVSKAYNPRGGNPSLQSKVLAASEKTKWTPKPGAPEARGTLTWTFQPAVR